ncbi:minor tail protein [Microbacterium phage Atraxi]|nr:minor tail protein [Microbacterium phage Atraxi]
MMPTISNSPQENAVIEAEARKSLSFGIWLKDANRNPVDITGTSTTFTVGKIDRYGVSTVLFSKTASIQAPTLGYEVIQVQAEDLNLTPGVYSFTTTLRINGYSVVLLKGDFKVLQNMEFESVTEHYVSNNPAQSLDIVLRESNNVHVVLGTMLPPSLTTPTDASDGGVAGYVSNPASLTFQALNALFVTHVELDEHTEWVSDQLALTLDAANDYTDAGLALKANVSTVNSALALKADLTYVNTQIATRLATSLLTTKGDILVRSTTPARLPIGANGTVLQADSAQTLGMKWVTRDTLLLRGTTAQRDAFFGVPGTDAARSALANRQVTWFNTDLGWDESYYCPTGLTGLTVQGLVAGSDSDWYPVGRGPRAVLYSAGAQAMTTGLAFSNWNHWGINKSYKNTPGNVDGSSFFFRNTNNAALQVFKAGRYRVRSAMGVQNGSGTAVESLRINQVNGTGIHVYQYPAQLQANYGQYFTAQLDDALIPKGGYAYHINDAGTLAIGQGDSYLSFEYLWPPFASVA